MNVIIGWDILVVKICYVQNKSAAKYKQIYVYGRNAVFFIQHKCGSPYYFPTHIFYKMKNSKKNRAVDQHSFFADPDSAVYLNADPDLA